jgi:uncharacterized membrane protein YoaK (UPF0700 family)
MRRTLLALTFVTGIVDAVAFLGLGQVFAAMQTGNVIFLGFGFAGAAEASLAAPSIALLAFLAGDGVAALISVKSPSRPRRIVVSRTLETLLIALAALVAALATVESGEAVAYCLIAMLSLAMGVRSTIVRQASPNLATTVLNLTPTGIGPQASSILASGHDLGERAAALLAIVAGAATGALLLETSLTLPLAVAAAITAATVLPVRLSPP